MAKKITVNKKLLDKINFAVATKMGLSDLKEFEEYHGCKLFNEPPEGWSEFENVICEYTQRVEMEIREAIEDILINGNAR